MGQLGWVAHLNQTYTTRWVSLHQAKASAWEQVTSGDQFLKKVFIICGGEIEYCLSDSLWTLIGLLSDFCGTLLRLSLDSCWTLVGLLLDSY